MQNIFEIVCKFKIRLYICIVKQLKQNKMTTSNNTNINWGTDSLNVICAKQELAKFLQEQTELKGKSSKIDAYHEKRISELNAFINEN